MIARISAFTYKGKAVDVKQVARELGVRLARQAFELARDDPETLWQAGHTLFFLAGDAGDGGGGC